MKKSASEKPFSFNRVIARASPSASCISVDDVGAKLCGQLSLTFGNCNKISAAFPNVLFAFAVNAIIGTPKRFPYLMISTNSRLSPENDISNNTSSLQTMPKSPWLASAG